MKIFLQIKIGIILNKYKNKLLYKTNFYNKYYINGKVNVQYILQLSRYEIGELLEILKIEESYIK